MTIVEAITHVLSKRDTALSVAEICRAIQDEDLFTFRTTHPVHVVHTQLRRHSVDSPEAVRSKQPRFRSVGSGKYALLK